MKMSVVGCEASGKTVFMSALADYYNGGDGRPCIVPENAAANNFQRFQLRQMRSLHLWPPATDPGKTIELKWTLRKDGKSVSEIDMLEFGGETFREAFRGEKASESHQAAVDALKQHLSSSEFVVVLVSLKELLRDQGTMTDEEFERDTEALWVTRGLLEFLRDQAPKARVVIGLTQADLHRGEIAAAGGAAPLFARQWPSVAAVAHDLPILPIASVSATDENGNPAPGYTTDGILPVMEEFKKGKSHAPVAGPRNAAGSGVSRRTLLLLLLLFASAALWFTYSQKPSATVPVKTTVIERVVQTNFVENTVTTTNVIENLVTTTNVVENTVTTTNVIENTVTTTNVVENLITKTNVIDNVVTTTNVIENVITKTNLVISADTPMLANIASEIAAPDVATNAVPDVAAPADPNPLRTWRDHNGTPIEARWIETTDDRKRIILETADGKRIRAAIRKFSAADQQFIADHLK